MFCCCTSSRSTLDQNLPTRKDLTVFEASRQIKTISNGKWEATFLVQEDGCSAKNFSVTLEQYSVQDHLLYFNVSSSPFVQCQKSTEIGLRVVQSIAKNCCAYGSIRLGHDIYFQGKHEITQTHYNPSTREVTFILETDSKTRANCVFQSLVLRPIENTKH